eukprot:TRINITY_DN7153_c0_g1_i1.p1 TRINITY_DN7153_c0_g1~~TRINITY_DN7153_c0_g1_i1.p1  ORF type:complete len:368 (+),score=30.10 TRINITY_DN7153_c0_g1_i1:119-1105(+)
MKRYFKQVLTGLLLLAVCQGAQVDFGHLGTDKLSSIQLIQKGEELSCTAYCNGANVTNLETPQCSGVFRVKCEYKSEKEEGCLHDICVGQFSRELEGAQADVRCHGWWHSFQSYKTELEEPVHTSKSLTCTGFFDATYGIESEGDSVPPGEIDIYCAGSEAYMKVISLEPPSMDLTAENIKAEFDEYVESAFGQDVQELMTFKIDDQDYNEEVGIELFNISCSSKCNDKPVSEDSLLPCFGEFAQKCSGIRVEETFTLDSECDGLHVGSVLGDLCLGDHELDFQGDFSLTEKCGKAYVNKYINQEKKALYYESCNGAISGVFKMPTPQ